MLLRLNLHLQSDLSSQPPVFLRDMKAFYVKLIYIHCLSTCIMWPWFLWRVIQDRVDCILLPTQSLYTLIDFRTYFQLKASTLFSTSEHTSHSKPLYSSWPLTASILYLTSEQSTYNMTSNTKYLQEQLIEMMERSTLKNSYSLTKFKLQGSFPMFTFYNKKLKQSIWYTSLDNAHK